MIMALDKFCYGLFYGLGYVLDSLAYFSDENKIMGLAFRTAFGTENDFPIRRRYLPCDAFMAFFLARLFILSNRLLSFSKTLL